MRGSTFLLVGLLCFLEVLPCDPHPKWTEPSLQDTIHDSVCISGPDHELCGSCDFEQDSCGWNDSSLRDFQWRLEKANVSSHPGADHTTGSPYGQFMHVEGSNAGLFSSAQLEKVTPKATSLACQITFWYHLFDSIGVSSEFSLSVITLSATKEVWKVERGRTVGWENATILLGNQPAGTKLRFSVKPSVLGEQDVALDDVAFHHCSDRDVPEGTTQLSCAFEEDGCAWYMDEGSDLRWQRSNGKKPYGNQGPGYDHTTGSGYYMFTAATVNSASSLKARLMSYPQPAGRRWCVSFWYHIYRGSVGGLKFISMQAGREDKVEWVRRGTQGNKWHFVDLQIMESDTAVQFVFEAEAGGTDGSIAIDDVAVSEAVNGTCPPERECTFQGSRCGLWDDPTGSFSWNRTTGALSNGTFCPAQDHTLGTAHGYYLSAQLWKQPSGHKGRIVTHTYNPTPKMGECLKFWFHMKGEHVGGLNIYLQKLRSSRNLLWTKSGDQGDLWRHGRATVLSHDTPYQIVFEAVAGDGVGGDIAIDDLLILNGPCPPDGFCDFEMDMCGWVNKPNGLSRVEWDWISASSGDSSYAPPLDHTTNSGLGHYLYFHKALIGPELTAQLLSDYMEPISTGCLVFWYHMDMFAQNENVGLTVFISQSGVLHSIWSLKGSQGKVWLEARANYTATEHHQILFEAKGMSFHAGDIAVDDIYVRKNVNCADLDATTPAPTTETTASAWTPMDCSFEAGLCSWLQDSNDSFDWIRQSGIKVTTPQDGPLYDHSLANEEGFYLLVSASGVKDDEAAVVWAPVAIQSSELCVGFWYHMLGSSVSDLDLLVQTNESEVVVWTRKGSQVATWLNAQVTISMANPQRVKFLGRRNTAGMGFIAIDDITVRAGPCADQDPCGFENPSMCDFEQDVTGSTEWVRATGQEARVDLSYRTQLGHSMAVFGKDLHKREVTQLLTPEFPATTESCLQFWYWLSLGISDSFSVHVLRNGEPEAALWSLSAVPSQSWEMAQVTISSPTSFKVAFRADLDAAPGSSLQLDEVSMRDGACTPRGSCDFESGQCAWRNSGIRDWVQANGRFAGPDVDHTTQTPDGRYLLSVGWNQSARASLTSERFQEMGSTCLSFWYQMNGSSSEALRGYLRSGVTQEDLFFEARESRDNWTHFSDTVIGPKGFQLVMEAESGTGGFIAIDDIEVTPGPCHDNGTVSGFAGCGFEEDTCRWEDVSTGQFAWHRDQNGTASANTGPSVDHTTGTQLGWYMAVEADDGSLNSYASLRSPDMKESGWPCLLEFYYHMYGAGIGELRVLLLEGTRSTLLWQMSGDQGDEWHQAVVGVGRNPGIFSLFFESTRTYSTLGDIAIDDITFYNCSLPEPQEQCTQDRFGCSNRVCVDLCRVCDFSDDCGDRSDETDCELKGYRGQCSFEEGLCSWERSDLDTPGAEWTSQKGETAWPELGPPRDHTRNTAAGYYAIPGLLLTKGQTSELVSSTLLPSANCSVRFYHYTRGEGSGQLSVRLRHVQSASDDRVMWAGDGSGRFFWERVEVTFSSAVPTKVVFQYKRGEAAGGGWTTALDDLSFSPECLHDPENRPLPPPSPPPSPSPCEAQEFFCWLSERCLPARIQCDYNKDCPLGEDEEGCGPCTFESGQCHWSDISTEGDGWQRRRANVPTEPDHTTGTGYYMCANVSHDLSLNEALLQSPSLPPSSPYCEILFHVRGRGRGQWGMSVLLRGNNSGDVLLGSHQSTNHLQWSGERLAVGRRLQPYRVVFSSLLRVTRDGAERVPSMVELDDISFHNCEASYLPPALSTFGCSFEEDLCGWVQTSMDNLDWVRRAGPTETANTGPAGDHTSGSGHYLYVETSNPSEVGNVALMKSLLLPPSGPQGYCLTFWYHMFGATVGTLRLSLQRGPPLQSMAVWQRAGVQGDEWQEARLHVTLQEVHRIVLESSVGGAAGDVAIDDVSLAPGGCPTSGLCDFEEGNCSWTRLTEDRFDWAWRSAFDTGPGSDHTTNTGWGHYLYLDSSALHRLGQKAAIASPLFPAGQGRCLHFWYHMYGEGVGTLNVYKQDANGERSLIFSKTGNQGALWRLGQARLDRTETSAFRVVVEGLKGPLAGGHMAVDDVEVSELPCPPVALCDFETGPCGWVNMAVEDDADWLRGRGGSPIPSTGPSVDHTSSSALGYYMYVDNGVGRWGDRSSLYSEVFQPDQSQHCLTFWYHMSGADPGSLSLYTSNRTLQANGNKTVLVWIESGDHGEEWREGRVSVDSIEPFWFIFQHQRGPGKTGHTALDDIQFHSGPCSSDPPIPSPSTGAVYAGLGVGLLLLVVVMAVAGFFLLQRRYFFVKCHGNDEDVTTMVTDLDCSLDSMGMVPSIANQLSEADWPVQEWDA